MPEGTHHTPLVLIEDEPVPGDWADEIEAESYVRIVGEALRTSKRLHGEML